MYSKITYIDPRDQDLLQNPGKLIDVSVPQNASLDEIKKTALEQIMKLQEQDKSKRYTLNIQRVASLQSVGSTERNETVDGPKHLKWESTSNTTFNESNPTISDILHITPPPNEQVDLSVFRIVTRKFRLSDMYVEDVTRESVVEEKDIPVTFTTWKSVTEVETIAVELKDKSVVAETSRIATRKEQVFVPHI